MKSYTMNRYQPFATETLIRAIQRGVIALADPEFKKDWKVLQQVREMRSEVIPRLIKMNRMDPKFFPKDVYVLYHKYSPPRDIDDWGPSTVIPDRNGIVTGHGEGVVLVRLEGDEYEMKIRPEDLKIKHIR